MHRIVVTAAAIAAAIAAAPAVAHGATLHQDGRTPHRVLLQDTVGETNLVSVEGSRSIVIHDANAPITIAGVPTCMPLDARTVSCSAVRRIELALGEGPDVAHISTPIATSIEGGPGPDRYVAGATDAPSRVDFAGGIGLDVANYFFATAGVEVSADLEAGDGRPGDDDRIRRDVEVLGGSQFGDALAGSHRTVELAGRDGDDRITGGVAEEILSGGDGQDHIDARDGVADTVDCGGQLFDSALVDLAGESAVTRCAEVLTTGITNQKEDDR